MADWSIATRPKLLAWYRRRARDLPWRRTRDPYAIWVSEIMLQQTRVAAVVPYYERFLARFPDLRSLARARIESVLALWSGLGYYRRARNLHAAARIVAREGLPDSAAGWRRLPGVGPYTASAVSSIALGERTAVVDGNVERVLCRLHAVGRERVADLAREWVSARAPGSHNQAVMELGATICTPRSPACPRCPLRSHCRSRRDPERHPAPKPRRAPVLEERALGLVRRNGRVLLRCRSTNPLSGMWELPETKARGEPLATVRHAIMDRRIVVRVYRGRAREGRWFSARQAARLPLAAATRKCLCAVGFLDSRQLGAMRG